MPGSLFRLALRSSQANGLHRFSLSTVELGAGEGEHARGGRTAAEEAVALNGRDPGCLARALLQECIEGTSDEDPASSLPELAEQAGETGGLRTSNGARDRGHACLRVERTRGVHRNGDLQGRRSLLDGKHQI